ncbi:hypothetical protein FGB62_74g113 [Gracilaria domingensis]|nr:hypothetical protein FGB62_74g113 [Gracilaria domingensis]
MPTGHQWGRALCTTKTSSVGVLDCGKRTQNISLPTHKMARPDSDDPSRKRPNQAPTDAHHALCQSLPVMCIPEKNESDVKPRCVYTLSALSSAQLTIHIRECAARNEGNPSEGTVGTSLYPPCCRSVLPRACAGSCSRPQIPAHGRTKQISHHRLAGRIRARLSTSSSYGSRPLAKFVRALAITPALPTGALPSVHVSQRCYVPLVSPAHNVAPQLKTSTCSSEFLHPSSEHTIHHIQQYPHVNSRPSPL